MADKPNQPDRTTTSRAADEPRSAAEKATDTDPAEVTGNPYPNYDLLSLDELRKLAKERDVEINPDVEKAHLVTELRAADTHTR